MIPILMYHQIGPTSPRGTPFRGLTVHPSSFRRQMTWLRRLGYQGLSMHDLMPYMRGERHGKVIGLTFDDGYRNVLENALPVLKSVGFTSTNYIVARQIGGSNVWDHAKGVPPSPLMTREELHAWIAAGQEVGSHTLNHPMLTGLPAEQAGYEIRKSKAELEEALDVPVSAFCYPYGDVSASIHDMVASAGYLSATTTERGLVRDDDDVMLLPRVTVARSTHMIRFFQKCCTSLEDRIRRAH